MMRRRSSPSVPKPFICTFWLTPPVLIAVKANPLLGVSQNAHLNNLGTEFFAPLRIISVNRSPCIHIPSKSTTPPAPPRTEARPGDKSYRKALI